MITVHIDRDDCILCGACWTDCPDVFEEGPDEGLSQIVPSYQTDGDPGAGAVPDNLQDCVQEAADGCPVEIIHVELEE